MIQTDGVVLCGQKNFDGQPELVVQIDGEKGAGKSLLMKILVVLIPFLPLGQVTIILREPA